MMFFPGNSPPEFFIVLPPARIKAAVADHFVMLFRNIADQTLDKFHNWDSFFHIFAIFMMVIMESDKITVIAVNMRNGDDRAANIFDGCFRVTGVGFGIDVEAIFMFLVTASLYSFKGGAESGLHFIEKYSTESVAEKSIVEMNYPAPETVVAVAAFRNEAVDVGVPFHVPAEGMEHHDKAGNEVQSFILFKKQPGNNTVHGMIEAVQKRTDMEVGQKRLWQWKGTNLSLP